MIRSLLSMKPAFKALLVIGGYVAAAVAAAAAVGIYDALFRGPDDQASHGMLAFADSILFLGVFGLAAIPATGGALYFLRPYAAFWRLACTLALVIAASGVAALIGCFVIRSADAGSTLATWVLWSPLRIFMAPLFIPAFFLSALFAPIRSLRYALLGAALIEGGVLGMAGLLWAYSML